MLGNVKAPGAAYCADVSTQETSAKNYGLLVGMIGVSLLCGPTLAYALPEGRRRLPARRLPGRGLRLRREHRPRRLRVALQRESQTDALVSFDLWRNCCIKNVVLFEENSILPLPERLESSGW